MSETENINCNSMRIKVENKEWIEMRDNSKRSECEAEVKSDYENQIMRALYGIDMTDNESNTLTENERSMSDDIQCLKTKSGYSRDSFDRFGDDLCEEMLSCLSFDDCFAYECVAKQWKRVLFNKENKLDIRDHDMDYNNDYHINKEIERFKLKMESITKKCTLINEIYIDNYNQLSINEYFAIILENCNQLKTIWINRYEGTCDVLRQSWILFGEKFGQSLQKMSFLSVREDSVKPLLRLTPNLIECEIKDLNDCFEESGEELLPELKVITAEINENSDLEMFSAMYAKRVEKITFKFNVKINCFYQMKINRLFAQLSRFTKLKALTINFESNSQDFVTFISTEALNSIAINSRHLSRLALNGLNFIFLISSNTTQIKFPNLKHLDLLHLYTFDLNFLKMCPNLVDLKLLTGPTDCNIIEAIEENAPQLKLLELSLHITDITDSSLQHLSRLRNLISLYIFSHYIQITANGLRQFLDIKPGIRKLCIQCKTNSNQDIIGAFIDLANRNPRRDYLLITNETFKRTVIGVAMVSRGLSRNDIMMRTMSMMANDADTVRTTSLTTNLKYISHTI